MRWRSGPQLCRFRGQRAFVSLKMLSFYHHPSVCVLLYSSPRGGRGFRISFFCSQTSQVGVDVCSASNSTPQVHVCFDTQTLSRTASRPVDPVWLHRVGDVFLHQKKNTQEKIKHNVSCFRLYNYESKNMTSCNIWKSSDRADKKQLLTTGLTPTGDVGCHTGQCVINDNKNSSHKSSWSS